MKRYLNTILVANNYFCGIFSDFWDFHTQWYPEWRRKGKQKNDINHELERGWFNNYEKYYWLSQERSKHIWVLKSQCSLIREFFKALQNSERHLNLATSYWKNKIHLLKSHWESTFISSWNDSIDCNNIMVDKTHQIYMEFSIWWLYFFQFFMFFWFYYIMIFSWGNK